MSIALRGPPLLKDIAGLSLRGVHLQKFRKRKALAHKMNLKLEICGKKINKLAGVHTVGPTWPNPTVNHWSMQCWHIAFDRGKVQLLLLAFVKCKHTKPYYTTVSDPIPGLTSAKCCDAFRRPYPEPSLAAARHELANFYSNQTLSTYELHAELD